MKKDLMSYCGDDILDAADKYWNNAKKQTLLRRLTVIGVAALLGVGIIAAALLTAAKINKPVPKPPETTAALPLNGVSEEVTAAVGTSASPDDSITAADTAGEITEPYPVTDEESRDPEDTTGKTEDSEPPVTDTETEAGSVTQPPETQEYKDPVFTAAEIGRLFEEQGREDVVTNAYIKIAVPSETELKYRYMSIPDAEKIGVYKIYTTGVNTTKAEEDRAQKDWDNVCKALGITPPEFGQYFGEKYVLYSGAGEAWRTFQITNRLEGPVGVTLDGIDVTVDQSKTDDELKEALKPVRDKLCELFGADLPDVHIKRSYDTESEYGCTGIVVTFYNAEKNGVDINVCSCSDHIILNFDNVKRGNSDVLSKTVLKKVYVTYVRYLCEPEAICEYTGDARLISIEEAEELLYKGYVFGGHCCPLCMAAQEKVSFENYDKVGLVYFEGVPFYAFFKNLHSDTPNGNAVYARTLVPAVEVSGYENYFESQKEFHKNR